MFPSARTRCRLSDEHKRDSGWMKQWATWPNLVAGPAPKFGEEVESQTGALPEAGSAVLSQALIRPESVQPQPAPHTWADSQQRKKRCQSRACPVPVLLQEGARARRAVLLHGTRRLFMWKATGTSALLAVN